MPDKQEKGIYRETGGYFLFGWLPGKGYLHGAGTLFLSSSWQGQGTCRETGGFFLSGRRPRTGYFDEKPGNFFCPTVALDLKKGHNTGRIQIGKEAISFILKLHAGQLERSIFGEFKLLSRVAGRRPVPAASLAGKHSLWQPAYLDKNLEGDRE